MQSDARQPGPVTADAELAKGYLLKEIPELAQIADITILNPFYLDSSNMGPDHWCMLADCISGCYHDYDGFVVLHGTDTMAYTASALSFALRPLTKPVILTGSQVPLTTLRSDAHRNLINAVEIATMEFAEVAICFDDRLFRGNRASKMSIGDFDAFASPNFPALAQIGLQIRFSDKVRPKGATFHNTARFDSRVTILKLFPGLNPALPEILLEKDIKGLLIEGFGSGNFPIKGEQSIVPFLENALAKGIIIAVCSQAPFDSIDLSKYESGRIAASMGILSAGAMTIEASITKMMYLLAHQHQSEMVRSQFVTDLAGELN